MSTLTILVMGKGGVGKSSTVNSIIGERAVTVSPFQVYAAFFPCHGTFISFYLSVHFVFVYTVYLLFAIVRRTKACYGVAFKGWIYFEHH